MKKLIVPLLIIAVGFLAYKLYGPQKPEFKEITNVQIEKFSNKEMSLTADAVIFNPNVVGIEVTSTDLDLLVNDKEAGKAINTESSVSGKANSDFSIPLRATINPKEILKNEGLIGGLAGLLGKKQFKVAYKGTVTVKVLFIPFEVPVQGETLLGQ